MSAFKVRLEENPSPEELRRIGRGLSEFNQQHAETDNWEPLAFFVRNEANEIVGGLYAERVWDWLEIKQLWVESHLRGLGFGSELMRAAEAAARTRKCRGIMLDTFSFQALDFYRKLEYQMFGKLDDFPRGHTRYFLRKTLNENQHDQD